MRYTFGTSPTAADRLREISRFFNPLAREFIGQFIKGSPHAALDLGCGPGYTTHMVKTATGCREIYGFDVSDEFLAMAAERHPDYMFIHHDITCTPFPVHPEAAYSRFILSHLEDPVSIINTWAGELCKKGLLFVEELEDIHTEIEVFKTYLEANRGLVASQGAELYVGKTIGAGTYNHEVLYNESVLLPVLNRRAASWFYPNTVSIWKHEDYIIHNFGPGERERISGELRRMILGNDGKSGITWKMRRMVIRRK
jgi:trans-aconitate 2-methyltransferase